MGGGLKKLCSIPMTLLVSGRNQALKNYWNYEEGLSKMSEETKRLQYLIPKDDPIADDYSKQCGVCKGHHPLKQMKSVGKETDLGYWFLCKKCNTALLLSHAEIEKADKN